MTEVAREYVDARRVLLDALAGLRPHLDAFVLVGAQAVYLRTVDRLPGYQPFTTDADLAFDPGRLADTPLLAEAMEGVGFSFGGQPGIWHRIVTRPDGPDVTISVDLIVPEHIAPAAGRRGARLPGGHGKTAAHKTVGVEGALVDYDPIEIHALDPMDRRTAVVNVAGPAALLVAKAIKLGERLDRPNRLVAKDAGDIFRLYDAYDIAELSARMAEVAGDPRSAAVAVLAMGYLATLFATPRSTGIDLAAAALAQIVPRDTVMRSMVDSTRAVVARFGSTL